MASVSRRIEAGEEGEEEKWRRSVSSSGWKMIRATKEPVLVSL